MVVDSLLAARWGPLEGWAAEKAQQAARYYLPTEPQRPKVRPHRRGPSTFELGEEVAIIGAEAANVRRSPGFTGKPAEDVIGQLTREARGVVTSASQARRKASPGGRSRP